MRAEGDVVYTEPEVMPLRVEQQISTSFRLARWVPMASMAEVTPPTMMATSQRIGAPSSAPWHSCRKHATPASCTVGTAACVVSPLLMHAIAPTYMCGR